MSSARWFIAAMTALSLAGCSDEPAPVAQQAPASTPPASVGTAPASAATASASPASTPAAPPQSRSSATLPPLPTDVPAARPPEIVRAVFTFAAEHPEVLSKMPCFCGCENRGHRHNDDCFVAGRDAKGRVTAWEPHGIS